MESLSAIPLIKTQGGELKTFIILYVLVLFSSVANSEVYRWEDADGVHISDNEEISSWSI